MRQETKIRNNHVPSGTTCVGRLDVSGWFVGVCRCRWSAATTAASTTRWCRRRTWTSPARSWRRRWASRPRTTSCSPSSPPPPTKCRAGRPAARPSASTRSAPSAASSSRTSKSATRATAIADSTSSPSPTAASTRSVPRFFSLHFFLVLFFHRFLFLTRPVQCSTWTFTDKTLFAGSTSFLFFFKSLWVSKAADDGKEKRRNERFGTLFSSYVLIFFLRKKGTENLM